MVPSGVRRQRILRLLEEQGWASVRELARRLGVSRMTVHRDLRRLEEEGRVQRVRGGAVLVEAPAPRCAVCGHPAPARTRGTLLLPDGRRQTLCCPHCLLLALERHREATGLVGDFLSGRVLDAREATFLFGPEVELCCDPPVLAFAEEVDARRFQKGFGGALLSLAEAREALALSSRS